MTIAQSVLNCVAFSHSALGIKLVSAEPNCVF